jgi:hypothetical protein
MYLNLALPTLYTYPLSRLQCVPDHGRSLLASLLSRNKIFTLYWVECRTGQCNLNDPQNFRIRKMQCHLIHGIS